MTVGTVHLVNCIAVFIGRQLCTVHARAGYCHRVHLHEGLESRELLLHHSVDHSFQLTQGDVCIQSTCSAACAALATIWLDCHLRLANPPSHLTPPLIATAPVIMFIIVLSFPPDFWEGKTPKALDLKNIHGRFAASS